MSKNYSSLITKTGDEAIEQAVSDLNNGAVNLTAFGAGGGYSLLTSTIEVKYGEESIAPDPKVKGCRILGDDRTVYVFPDRLGHDPEKIAATIAHEKLHIDQNLEKVSQDALSSSQFAGLSDEELDFVKKVIEEKAIRDTIQLLEDGVDGISINTGI